MDVTELEANRTRHTQALVELTRARSRLADRREDERIELARELHDGILQELLALTSDLANDEKALRQQGQGAPAGLMHAYWERVLHSATELRRAVRGFRPAAIRDLGLWTALRESLPDLTRTGDPEIVLPIKDDLNLPERLQLVLFRVAQEAVRNALKHAQASRVEVTLAAEGEEAVLRVADDG